MAVILVSGHKFLAITGTIHGKSERKTPVHLHSVISVLYYNFNMAILLMYRHTEYVMYIVTLHLVLLL